MADNQSFGDVPDHDPPDHTLRVQQLFVKHQSRVKAYILSLQPNFSEAEDILQDVFLVLTRKAKDFQEGSNFMAWVVTIARFKVLEALRHRRAGELVLSEETVEILAADWPAEEGENEARFAALRVCLERLAPRSQEVIRLRYFGERGPGEIARLLGWSPNSVNVALSKARQFMHDCVARRLQKT